MVVKPSSSAISVASVANATELKASRHSDMSKFASKPRLKLSRIRNSSGTKKPSSTGSRHAANAAQPLMPAKHGPRRQPRAFGGKLDGGVAAAVAFHRDQAGDDRKHEARELRRAGQASAIEPGREDRHRQASGRRDIRWRRYRSAFPATPAPRLPRAPAAPSATRRARTPSSGRRRASWRPRRIPRFAAETSRAPTGRHTDKARC